MRKNLTELNSWKSSLRLRLLKNCAGFLFARAEHVTQSLDGQLQQRRSEKLKRSSTVSRPFDSSMAARPDPTPFTYVSRVESF